MRTAALERAIAHRPPADRGSADRCGLCALSLPDDHPHLFDMDAREPVCVCRACAILFDRPGAATLGTGGVRLRRVPERRLRAVGFDPAAVHVPVGLAFFVRHGDGSVDAHYPSPAGATRFSPSVAEWEDACRTCPEAGLVEPDVEALLANTVAGRREAYVVPITDCYRLVGLVRRHWSGLSGGGRVWQEIEGFFEELRRDHGNDPGR